MHIVSDTWREIVSGVFSTEAKCVVDGVEYGMNDLYSLVTRHSTFPQGLPTLGGTCSGEIDITLTTHGNAVSRMAKIEPYVRVTDGAKTSEWIRKGVYYVDTRSYDPESDRLTLHGYDAMLKGEQTMLTPEESDIIFPRIDTDVLDMICEKMGIELDNPDFFQQSYMIPHPGIGESAYTIREVLGFIGSMYGGNWTVTDDDKLRLIPFGNQLFGISNLVTHQYEIIEIGGDYILV